MVLHTLAAVVLGMGASGAVQAPDFGNVDREFAESQVRTLIQAIDAKDPAGHPSIDLALEYGPRWMRGDTIATVYYPPFKGVYDKRTGNLLSFEVDSYSELLKEGWRAAPGAMLDEETCLAYAREYLRLVQPSVDIPFVRSHPRGQLFVFEMYPKLADLPLRLPVRISMEIDRRKGQLVNLRLPARVPDVSLATAPRVSESMARAAARNAYLRYRPFPLAHAEGGALALGVPEFGTLPNEMTAEHFALAQQYRAIPLYSYVFGNATTWDPLQRSYRQWQTIPVDARTGRALAIMDYSLPYGARSRLEWPEGPVSLGEEGTEIEGAAWTPAKAPEDPPARGQTRVVRIGEKLLVIGFDPASGLCWLGDGSDRLYATPNAPLRRALEAAPPAPKSSFGEDRS